jgi:hypothetical protein
MVVITDGNIASSFSFEMCKKERERGRRPEEDVRD